MHKQGDILLVPVPFTDLSSQKKRPVLVLSNHEYNVITDDLVVAAITSLIDTKPYTVRFSDSDMLEGDMAVDSCIRADKIYTLSQTLIIKKFGRVSTEIMSNVKVKINDLLG